MRAKTRQGESVAVKKYGTCWQLTWSQLSLLAYHTAVHPVTIVEGLEQPPHWASLAPLCRWKRSWHSYSAHCRSLTAVDGSNVGSGCAQPSASSQGWRVHRQVHHHHQQQLLLQPLMLKHCELIHLFIYKTITIN